MVGFAKAFDQTDMAQRTRGTLAQPYEAPNPKCEEALIQYKYALSGEFLPLTFFTGGSAKPGSSPACEVLINLVSPCLCAFPLLL